MKKRNIKVMSMAMTAIMSVSFFMTSKSQVVMAYDSNKPNDLKKALIQQLESKINKGDTFSGVQALEKDNENSSYDESKNPEEKVRVIVELQDKPATLELEDGIQPSEELINKVKAAQKPIQDEVIEKTGAEIRHVYGNLINGFSTEIKRKDIDKIKEIDGVVDVTEVNIYYPDMSSAKEFTEALDVWNDYGYKGEGLVVSVIDTGIDPSHKDMRLTDTSKAKLNSENTDVGEGKFYTDKVPYGYNFADENDEIVDLSGSMHGMHVSGIIAANATDDEVNANEGIKGVAPEAQLLAMKVFTNNPEISGAYADDIIAAIETSVELDADVINMSLGANAGFRNAEDPEQVAIKNATDDGVICVVSAGNSATSLDPYVIEGISDTGVVGSPGLAQDALQVASSDNSYITLQAFEAIIGDTKKLIGYTQCDVEPTEVFTSEEKLQLVDCGYGETKDFEKKDVEGKVALVSRGNITFVEKQLNAQAAGAKAVIIYNNVENAGTINMATDESMKIPAMFITKEDADLLKNGPLNAATISFKGDVTSMVNPTAAEMSSYTSWGPTPNLEFAPQITAPGGNIYSTLNGNKYGSMSGTSMAAPHVAGATALIIQGLKDEGIELEGRELVEYVKKSIINTAKTLTETNAFGEENIPYSPRRQGSGLIQTKDAIDNRVLVTGDDGEATVSLKEIGDKTNFKLTLKNYSNEDKKYKVNSLGDVLTAFTPSMADASIVGIMSFDTILEGATLSFDKDTVTVPANGEAEVNVTLDVKSGSVSNNFVEGFIKFISEDEEVPSLVVPYMGYYGDWSEESIIDGLAWEDNVTVSPSFAATEVLGDYNYLGYVGSDQNGVILDPEKIAISPNGDELGDAFVPALYFLRNAKEINVDLLDENGNVVAKNINAGIEFRKKVFSGTNGTSASIYPSIDWDGTVYNKATGKNEVVKEGQYYLNYKARVDGENTKYQDYKMPVKVDLTPIKANILSDIIVANTDTYNLELDFGGELENGNLNNIVIGINGATVSDEVMNSAVVDGDKLSVNIALPNDTVNTIEVLTLDNAYNIGYDSFEVTTGESEASVKIENFPDGEYVDSDTLVVEGTYSGPVKEILINGEAPDTMANGMFTKTITLKEGKNVVSLFATDKNGKVIANYGHKVYLDTIAPELTLYSPVIDENGIVVTDEDFIVVKGMVNDASESYSLFINGEKKLVVEQSGGTIESNVREFEYEVPVEDGDIVTVKAVDIVNHETVKQFTVSKDAEAPIITIEGVENGKAYNSNVKPVIKVNKEDATVTSKLNDQAYNGEEISEEGNYILQVQATGTNGEVSSKTVEFSIDKTAPIITIEGVENGKAYNTNVLPKITFEEGTINTVTLNGEEYDYATITEEGTYELNATSIDKAGNNSEVTITFEIDKTAPVITVEGVVDGMKYDKAVKAIITVNETAETVSTLNGNPYNGEEITENGDYLLKVVATDKAGNVTETTIEFTIKLPEISTDNPTPTPTPTPNPGQQPGGTINDDNVSGGSTGKGETNIQKNNKLPNTGGTNMIYPVIIGIILVAGGSLILLKKKKETK